MAAWRPQEEKQREAGEKRSLSAEAFPASLGRAPPMAGQCKAGLRASLPSWPGDSSPLATQASS